MQRYFEHGSLAVVLLTLGCLIRQFRCLNIARRRSRSVPIMGLKLGVESGSGMVMHFRSKVVGCCGCALMIVQLGFAAAPRGQKPAQQQPPTPMVETPPPIPQAPPTPEQMPAVPPRVSMNHGMLSISADNSTLGDILNSVRQQTGATLEVPPSIAN